jgi:hypothetical protein
MAVTWKMVIWVGANSGLTMKKELSCMKRLYSAHRPSELISLLATLPPGRHRVAWALLADSCGATYADVAARLGLHLGTVHQHLRRIRLRHAEVYVVLMAERSCQLAKRHERAMARAKEHTERWYISRLPAAGVAGTSRSKAGTPTRFRFLA